MELLKREKEKILKEVLEKLHHLAKMESELIFRVSEHYGGSLPHAGKVISGAVNISTDTLDEASAIFSEKNCEYLLQFFRNLLPQTMANLAFDIVSECIPDLNTIKDEDRLCKHMEWIFHEHFSAQFFKDGNT